LLGLTSTDERELDVSNGAKSVLLELDRTDLADLDLLVTLVSLREETERSFAADDDLRRCHSELSVPTTSRDGIRRPGGRCSGICSGLVGTDIVSASCCISCRCGVNRRSDDAAARPCLRPPLPSILQVGHRSLASVSRVRARLNHEPKSVAGRRGLSLESTRARRPQQRAGGRVLDQPRLSDSCGLAAVAWLAAQLEVSRGIRAALADRNDVVELEPF